MFPSPFPPTKASCLKLMRSQFLFYFYGRIACPRFSFPVFIPRFLLFSLLNCSLRGGSSLPDPSRNLPTVCFHFLSCSDFTPSRYKEFLQQPFSPTPNFIVLAQRILIFLSHARPSAAPTFFGPLRPFP